MKLALTSLRVLAFIEGISYLILLGIAMPLKYYYDQPNAVKTFGMVHGVLFILFVINLLLVHMSLKWSIGKTLGVFVSSLIPFGTFYADIKWFRTTS